MATYLPAKYGPSFWSLVKYFEFQSASVTNELPAKPPLGQPDQLPKPVPYHGSQTLKPRSWLVCPASLSGSIAVW